MRLKKKNLAASLCQFALVTLLVSLSLLTGCGGNEGNKADTNNAPTITGMPVTEITVNSAYSFQPSAADIDGDALTFLITDQPNWANFDPVTGQLSGIPTTGGTHLNIVISVSDGEANTALAAFTITVTTAEPDNRAPTIIGAPMTTVTVNTAYDFQPTAVDADADALTYTITNRPDWASFNTETGQLSGTPTSIGTYANIVIGISDGEANASLDAFTITVNAAEPNNQAPTITGSPMTLVTVNTLYGFQPTTSDADGDILTYAIANQPDWASFNTSTGQLSGTPTNTGTHPNIIISVSDGEASIALEAFTITVTGVIASADLCEGMIQDTLAHPMPALTKPAKGTSVNDPTFGTKIVRVTDVQADFSANVAKPTYSTMPAWNADESYLLLYITGSSSANGHHLFNGKTYEHIRKLDIAPTDLEHVAWSRTEPDIFYYTYSWQMSANSLRQIIKYHVSSGQKEVLYDVPNAASPGSYRVDMGGDPIYTSWDNDVFGLCRRGSPNTGFTYRVSTNTESSRVPGASACAPQISPSGNYYIFGQTVMNTATNASVRTMHSDTIEHADMTMLANGQDVWLSVQFSVAPYGTLIAENLNTGVVTEIIGQNTGSPRYPYPPSGTHISGHAFQKPGWVAVSVIGNPDGQSLLSQEILLADINTNKVCRVAHHRSTRNGPRGYWAEPHVNISPSGTRLLFASDWSGGATVDAYVVELPSYQP